MPSNCHLDNDVSNLETDVRISQKVRGREESALGRYGGCTCGRLALVLRHPASSLGQIQSPAMYDDDLPLARKQLVCTGSTSIIWSRTWGVASRQLSSVLQSNQVLSTTAGHRVQSHPGPVNHRHLCLNMPSNKPPLWVYSHSLWQFLAHETRRPNFYASYSTEEQPSHEPLIYTSQISDGSASSTQSTFRPTYALQACCIVVAAVMTRLRVTTTIMQSWARYASFRRICEAPNRRELKYASAAMVKSWSKSCSA